MIYQTPPTGGKTIMAKACLRDTFSDMLSANFKTATPANTQKHMSNSTISLMIAIARQGYREFKPSEALIRWLSIGGFCYAGQLAHRDSSFLMPKLIRLSAARRLHWFAFDSKGGNLGNDFKMKDIHYLVIAFAPDSFSIALRSSSEKDDKGATVVYPLNCVTLVPTHLAQAELSRSFVGVAGIQLFEASLIYSTGFVSRYNGDRLAMIDSQTSDFNEESGSSMEDVDLAAIYRSVNDLEMRFFTDNDGVTHLRNIRAEGLKLSSFITAPGIVTTTSLVTFDDDAKPVSMNARCAILESDIFDPFSILRSDRCFLESSVGFKHLERQGISSAAVASGITSSFLLSLFSSNESEIFMSYVPYGQIDPIGNGSFDLGGYSAGQMWVKHEGANEHPFFTKTLASKGKFAKDTIAFTTRALGERERLIYLCKDDEVYGKSVVLSRNKLDPSLLPPEAFDAVLPDTIDIPELFSEWEITHGHLKLSAGRKDVDVPYFETSSFENWSVNGSEDSHEFHLPRELTLNT